MKSPPRDPVVRVTGLPGREHVGIVVDSRILADAAFLMVGLPLRSAPVLPVGGTADVVLDGDPGDPAVTNVTGATGATGNEGLGLEAWVSFRSEEREQRNYELVLLSEPSGLADALSHRMDGAPGSPGSPRSPRSTGRKRAPADASPPAPPIASVRAPGLCGADGEEFRIDAPLVELSATAMVLEVQLEQERRLASTCRLSVSVALPGEDDRLAFEARIGRRRLHGSTVRYDLDLLVAGTPDYYSQEDRVRRYLRMSWKD